MNARRRTKPDGLPSRVYKRNGSFHWVRPNDQKWIKLCRIDEGESRVAACLRNKHDIGQFSEEPLTGAAL